MKYSEIIEKNKDSIILLEIAIPQQDGKVRRGIRGTGFIISKDGKFITCAHVYDKIPENERDFLGAMVPEKTDEKGITYYKRHKIELLKMDKENDIALMKIDSENNSSFKAIEKFGDSDSVKPGDEVIFLGYPLAMELIMMGFGLTMNADQCIISSIKRRGQDGSLHFFMVDTHINSGSSGSPVFSKNLGKAIGIASGKISSKIPLQDGKHADIPANIGICRPINYANNLINIKQ